MTYQIENKEIPRKRVRRFEDKIIVGRNVANSVIRALSEEFELDIEEIGNSYENAKLHISVYKVLEN